MCVSRLLCCLQLQIPYVQTHTQLRTVWPLVIIYHKYIYTHLYQGKQAILGSSSASSNPAWIYNTELISAPVHPFLSHHFNQLSASTSPFLLIAHNNPPKSLSGSAFPNSQSRKTMAAQRKV